MSSQIDKELQPRTRSSTKPPPLRVNELLLGMTTLGCWVGGLFFQSHITGFYVLSRTAAGPTALLAALIIVMLLTRSLRLISVKFGYYCIGLLGGLLFIVALQFADFVLHQSIQLSNSVSVAIYVQGIEDLDDTQCYLYFRTFRRRQVVTSWTFFDYDEAKNRRCTCRTFSDQYEASLNDSNASSTIVRSTRFELGPLIEVDMKTGAGRALRFDDTKRRKN